jgi:surface antigen
MVGRQGPGKAWGTRSEGYDIIPEPSGGVIGGNKKGPYGMVFYTGGVPSFGAVFFSVQMKGKRWFENEQDVRFKG